MRFNLGPLLAGALIASVASPAIASPTKAETAVRDMSDAHGKAGLLTPFINVLAAAEAPSPAQAKPDAPSHARPAVPAHPRATEVLGVKDLSPAIDFVTVLPGQRFPLRAINANGEPMLAKWRADGGTLALGDHVAVWQAPLQPGVHKVTGYALLHRKVVKRTLSMIVTVPTANVHDGKLNGYPIGTYPRGFGQPAPQIANRGSRDFYMVPTGFIELSMRNMDTPVSEHYRLGDFAGKDNWVGGHKYLFLEPRMVEKLETLIATLKSEGYHVNKIPLLSAYRSPFLNEDIGNKTTLSRHTYGDAADMIVGDYNGDGRADRRDADILMAAVTKLDKETPLVGGASLYKPNGAHGYFIHTDTRGTLVRW